MIISAASEVLEVSEAEPTEGSAVAALILEEAAVQEEAEREGAEDDPCSLFHCPFFR